MKKIYNPLKLVCLVGRFGLLALSIFYIIDSLNFFVKSDVLLGKYASVRWFLYGHIFGGILALATGTFLFSSKLRIRYPSFHRSVGKLYFSAVFWSAFGALVLVLTSARVVGLAYEIALHVQGIAWTISAAIAWRFALLKEFKFHNQWTVRNYILTIAFIVQSTLFKMPFFKNLGGFESLGATIIWLSWSIPIFFYDIYLSISGNKFLFFPQLKR